MSDGGFDSWRRQARAYLAAGRPPEQVVWHGDNLFAPDLPPASIGADASFAVPRSLMALLNRLACHRDERRWDLMYAALWRVRHGERHLQALATDPLMHSLRRMDGEIRRDAHKTKAFVRFRQIARDGHDYYIAWHRPDHRVLPLVAPFFKRRFSVMRWSIANPDASVSWDGAALQFGPGIETAPQINDATEDLWLNYYAATFNPARLKIKMMKREMPVRHWATLPETRLIPQLIADAAPRVGGMIEHREGYMGAAQFVPPTGGLDDLRAAARICRGCDLHCAATQTVFGAGPGDAPIMIVGEQPGDEEDHAGRPFVGPAGATLDAVLSGLSLPRDRLYLTNAVKHFKFQPAGQRRLHRTASAGEVNACKPWLLAEIAALRPRAIVTLGGTAAKSLIHHGFSVKNDLDRPYHFHRTPIFPSWHPAAALRATQPGEGQRIRAHIAATIARARSELL